MSAKKTRYKKMEVTMTAVICLDTAIFLAYLIFAGIGLLGLKIITAILSIVISGIILYFLFISKELLRKRSLWMTYSAACILLCIIVSLVLNFPAPRFTLP